MIWTLILFGISMYILAKLGVPTDLGGRWTSARRRSRSRSTPRSSMRVEADKLLGEYRERLQEARQQAEEIVTRARRSAETVEARLPEGGPGRA